MTKSRSVIPFRPMTNEKFKLTKEIADSIRTSPQSNQKERLKLVAKLRADYGWSETTAYRRIREIKLGTAKVVATPEAAKEEFETLVVMSGDEFRKSMTENSIKDSPDRPNDEFISRVIIANPTAKVAILVDEPKEVLIDCGTHKHNTQTDQFIWQLKNGIVHTSPTGEWKQILLAYNNKSTLAEISLKFHIPVIILKEVFTKEGITHESTPDTSLDVRTKSVTELTEAEIKYKHHQAREDAKWKATQIAADKYREFQYGTLDPFEAVLTRWKAPIYQPIQHYSASSLLSDKVFVVGLSDLHYGAASRAKYMYNRQDWSTKQTVEAVSKYALDITKEVRSRNYSFKKAVILGLGDLIHSMNGKTARGTELSYDTVKEEQFDYAMDSLSVFIDQMIQLFGSVEVHSVYGNHHYEVEMALFRALAKHFRNDERIKFYHYSTRPAAFRVDSTLFMIDHGADSIEKSYVPGGPKREPYVLNLLVSQPELLKGVKSKLFCQGDKHHWENVEYNQFEFIMFSTILGADMHASVNNWNNRARQSCLVLDSDGLREVIHTYF